jgi:hypothetical protein
VAAASTRSTRSCLATRRCTRDNVAHNDLVPYSLRTNCRASRRYTRDDMTHKDLVSSPLRCNWRATRSRRRPSWCSRSASSSPCRRVGAARCGADRLVAIVPRRRRVPPASRNARPRDSQRHDDAHIRLKDATAHSLPRMPRGSPCFWADGTTTHASARRMRRRSPRDRLARPRAAVGSRHRGSDRSSNKTPSVLTQTTS